MVVVPGIPLAVKDEAQASVLCDEIWPNPASGKIQIRCPQLVSQKVQVNIFSNTGQLVNAAAEKMTDGGGLLDCDVQQLPKGIYYVQLNSEKFSFGRKLIVE